MAINSFPLRDDGHSLICNVQRDLYTYTTNPSFYVYFVTKQVYSVRIQKIKMAEQSVNPECVSSASGSAPVPPALCIKSKELPVDQSDSESLLLNKREFFHSQRAQPMALDQLLSEKDSEDEVDKNVADIEDRQMIGDFIDVTNDEKHIMNIWNSFVRKQRVLTDGHVPWVCKEVSKLHKQEFVQAPPLYLCWRLFMIKLWNHGLIDARTVDTCNTIIQEGQK